jgi:hypothetical protein
VYPVWSSATRVQAAVCGRSEDYCNSQILISGGDPKELGSIHHAMAAWACSNPDVLEN